MNHREVKVMTETRIRHMQQTQLHTRLCGCSVVISWRLCGFTLSACRLSLRFLVLMLGERGSSHTPPGLLSQKLPVLIGRMLQQDVEFMLIRERRDSSGPDNGDV